MCSFVYRRGVVMEKGVVLQHVSLVHWTASESPRYATVLSCGLLGWCGGWGRKNLSGL